VRGLLKGRGTGGFGSTGASRIVAALTLNPEDEERRRSVCSPPGPMTGVLAPSSASVLCSRPRSRPSEPVESWPTTSFPSSWDHAACNAAAEQRERMRVESAAGRRQCKHAVQQARVRASNQANGRHRAIKPQQLDGGAGAIMDFSPKDTSPQHGHGKSEGA
jgi:hypothetical protein